MLGKLSLPSRTGATRTAGTDLNKPPIRTAPAAALALAAAPHGVTIAEFTAKARLPNRHTGHTTRHGAYHLRNLPGNNLALKPGRGRRSHIPPQAAHTITAQPALHDQVITPTHAGNRRPQRGRKPARRTPIHRHYPTLRTGIQNHFDDPEITPTPAAATSTTLCRSEKCKLLASPPGQVASFTALSGPGR